MYVEARAVITRQSSTAARDATRAPLSKINHLPPIPITYVDIQKKSSSLSLTFSIASKFGKRVGTRAKELSLELPDRRAHRIRRRNFEQ
jgi:hypothetical protein